MRQRRIGLVSVLVSVIVLIGMMWLTSMPAGARLLLTATPSTTPAAELGSRENPLSNPCTDKPFITIMTNAGIKSAKATLDLTYNNWAILFELAPNDEAYTFSKFTKANIGQQIGVVLDGKVYFAPTVNAPILDDGQIVGQYTKSEANAIARLISTKPLPAEVTLVSTNTQDGKLIITVAADAELDAETFDALATALTERVDSLAFDGDISVQVESRQITFSLSPTSEDEQQFAIEYLSRAGLLEFVDFSKPKSCTEIMPDTDQYIVTDYQLALYGK